MASKNYFKMFENCFIACKKLHNSKEVTKQSIIKNYTAFSLSFFLIFTAINGIQSVQSIINSSEYLGITSQILIVSIQIPLSISIPTIFIELCG
jgi:hypothetical protein